MKRQEFKQIVKLAVSESFEAISYFSPEMSVFSGCALDSNRRFVTREQLASLITHHCLTFAGTWDFAELEELQGYSKRFDLVN